MHISKESVEDELRVFYPDITRAILHSTQECKQQCRHLIPRWGTKTLANVFSDHVRNGLAEFAEASEYFDTFKASGGFLLYSGNLALRPKKLNRNLRSQNIQTKKVIGMKEQSYVLPGLEDERFYLTLGYLLDENTYDLKGVYVINEGISSNLWELKIDSFLGVEQKAFDIPVEQQEVQEVRKRVRVKLEKKKAVAV